MPNESGLEPWHFEPIDSGSPCFGPEQASNIRLERALEIIRRETGRNITYGARRKDRSQKPDPIE